MIIETKAALKLIDKYFKINNMKNHKKELNMDTIGGQGSLTIEEEKALSTFLKQRKLTSTLFSNSKRSRTVKAQKVKV